ncbi:MAG: rod shape-determining protein MreC [Chloroflexi bacterium]|nr:MAG: rod shape-determining protein MreC [Chloroflexota bacterium]
MNLNEAPQRIRVVIIVVLVGTAVLLSILDATGNLNSLFSFIRDPMTIILAWTSGQAKTVSDTLSGPRDLQTAKEEIALLQAQVDALERENEELREIQGEYQLLLDLFNRVRQSPEYTRQTASVIGHDTSPSIRSIIIDKGSDDGVRVGMPVESARGLVGRVYRTTSQSAQVALITDNASAIPARLGNSRATGLLRGGGLGGSLTMDWIDLKYQVEIGEVALTSGLGGKFPQDIVIGRVSEVERSEAELSQQAVVQPAADFDALEVVFVITNFQPINIDIFNDPPGN